MIIKMKLIAIMLVVLNCIWQDIPTSDLAIEDITAMIEDDKKLIFSGVCGGTQEIKINFDNVQYCQSLNQIKIKGNITTKDSNEPYPYINIVVGQEMNGRIKRSSKIMVTDSLGAFNLIMDYKSYSHTELAQLLLK